MTVDLKRFGLHPQLPSEFDHQVTGTMGECERMAYYQHILGRRLDSQDKTALNWGSAMHGAADIWAKTQDPAEVQEFIQNSLDENAEDRYGRTKGRLFEAFVKYAQFMQMNHLEVIRAEQPTLITCDSGETCPYFEEGCGLTYGGRIDKIVRWQGMVGPLDLKTTVMNDKDPVTEYRPSHQFMGYVWVVGHLMKDHCWGAIVDRIVTNKSNILINRFPVSFTKDNIKDWVRNERALHGRIHYLFDNYPEQEDMWIQNYARCANPYPCNYRDVCLSGSEMDFRYKWLAQNTTEWRWDFRDPDKTGNG